MPALAQGLSLLLHWLLRLRRCACVRPAPSDSGPLLAIAVGGHPSAMMPLQRACASRSRWCGLSLAPDPLPHCDSWIALCKAALTRLRGRLSAPYSETA